MSNMESKELSVSVDILVGYFLKLLQRDGVITNSTYLEATKMLKEEKKNVDSI